MTRVWVKKKKKKNPGVPITAQWLTNPTRSHEVVDSIPGLTQWLRIQHCCELWCRSQTWLGSRVAVTVAQASSYSSDWAPNLRTSICCSCSPKIKKVLLQFVKSYLQAAHGLRPRWVTGKGMRWCVWGLSPPPVHQEEAQCPGPRWSENSCCPRQSGPLWTLGFSVCLFICLFLSLWSF